MGTVYYFPGRPSDTISLGALKFYVGFQKVTYKPLEYCDVYDPQSQSCRSPYQNQNNLDYIQIYNSKVNPQINRNIFFPTVCALSKHNICQLMHDSFGSVSIVRLKQMARKGLMEGTPKISLTWKNPVLFFS